MTDNLHHLPRIGMGEAQALYGMTARALRFYEERGLVVAHRDRLNSRYFDGKARRRLGWISSLRSAGLSLPDIRDVLEAEEGGRGAATARAKLEARLRLLTGELERVSDLSRTLSGHPDGASYVA